MPGLFNTMSMSIVWRLHHPPHSATPAITTAGRYYAHKSDACLTWPQPVPICAVVAAQDLFYVKKTAVYVEGLNGG